LSIVVSALERAIIVPPEMRWAIALVQGNAISLIIQQRPEFAFHHLRRSHTSANIRDQFFVGVNSRRGQIWHE